MDKRESSFFNKPISKRRFFESLTIIGIGSAIGCEFIGNHTIIFASKKLQAQGNNHSPYVYSLVAKDAFGKLLRASDNNNFTSIHPKQVLFAYYREFQNQIIENLKKLEQGIHGTSFVEYILSIHNIEGIQTNQYFIFLLWLQILTSNIPDFMGFESLFDNNGNGSDRDQIIKHGIKKNEILYYINNLLDGDRFEKGEWSPDIFVEYLGYNEYQKQRVYALSGYEVGIDLYVDTDKFGKPKDTNHYFGQLLNNAIQSHAKIQFQNIKNSQKPENLLVYNTLLKKHSVDEIVQTFLTQLVKDDYYQYLNQQVDGQRKENNEKGIDNLNTYHFNLKTIFKRLSEDASSWKYRIDVVVATELVSSEQKQKGEMANNAPLLNIKTIFDDLPSTKTGKLKKYKHNQIQKLIKNPDQYIESYASIAQAQMTKYNIPASITLAQGILESRYGTSKLCRSSNNHFGVKCTAHSTDKHKQMHNNKIKTGAICHNAHDDNPWDYFTKYPNTEASFKAHSLFLHRYERYHFLFEYTHLFRSGKLKHEDMVWKWCKGLKSAGYATSATYAQKLWKIIDVYDLMQFDEIIG